jgi:hypothetical protein
MGDLPEPQSSVVSLSVSTIITVAGLKQVDFFIDGILFQTKTTGAPQPGVPVVVYNARGIRAPILMARTR